MHELYINMLHKYFPFLPFISWHWLTVAFVPMSLQLHTVCFLHLFSYFTVFADSIQEVKVPFYFVLIGSD